MPKKRSGRTSSGGSGSGGASGAVVLSFLLGAGAAAGGAYLYLHSTPAAPGRLATATPAAIPARPNSAPAPPKLTEPHPHPAPTPPFGISEDVYESGAHLYAARCAGCHGTPRHDSPVASSAKPPAPQLWRPATRRSIAAQSPGEIYTRISVGLPSHGMPAYKDLMTDAEIWKIALLLKNANEELPDPVTAILNRP